MDITQSRLAKMLPLANFLEQLDRQENHILPNASGIVIQVACPPAAEGQQAEGFQFSLRLGHGAPAEATLRALLLEAIAEQRSAARKQIEELGVKIRPDEELPKPRQARRADARKVAQALQKAPAKKTAKRGAKS